MKTETPYTFYEYKVSPNYNEIKNFSNPKTPQIFTKKETSEMILSQTKASLNNFLSNLKKVSTINDNKTINDNNKKLFPTMSNLSRISSIKFQEDDDQPMIESYIKLSKKYDNNLNNNLLNYNKITNINAYREMNKTISQNNYNKNQIRLNNLFDSNIFENNNNSTEEYLKDKKLRYLNTIDYIPNNIGLYNTVRRAKYNFGLGINHND